jgi:hypothetical protein
VVNDAQARERFDRGSTLDRHSQSSPYLRTPRRWRSDGDRCPIATTITRDTVTVRYLVMELLRGRNAWPRACHERRCQMDEALHYAAQIASGRSTGHIGSGIVHPRLSSQATSSWFLPMARHPAFTTKLLDFGLAKQDGGSDALESRGVLHFERGGR